MRHLLSTALLLFGLAGCTGALDGLDPERGQQPIPAAVKTLMAAKGMSARAPILLRIFKTENVLEVWKRSGEAADAPYALLKSYEICKFSGHLGPKFKEGDRQAPEGFYEVGAHLLNPNSRYYLAINMGYPNAYDRAHDRTGSYLMIHGACSSAGCYSMTDDYAREIYTLAREAFRGGQRRIQIQAFPFRMTADAMAKHRDHPQFDFWRMIKPGHDQFELTRRPPVVNACAGQYVFNMKGLDTPLPSTTAKRAAKAACPPMGMERKLAGRVVSKMDSDRKAFEKIVAEAEGREPKALPKLTFAKAFPNAKLVGEGPEPTVPVVPVVPELPKHVPEVVLPASDTSPAAAEASKNETPRDKS